MFSYVSPEQRMPADHPLRPIREMTDGVLRQLSRRFAGLYAKTGRPSIAPEKLLGPIEHTLRAGPGAQLDVTVAEDGGDAAGFRQVQQQFALLNGRGVAVDVHRNPGHRVNQAA
jgi:hypothetical protein